MYIYFYNFYIYLFCVCMHYVNRTNETFKNFVNTTTIAKFENPIRIIRHLLQINMHTTLQKFPVSITLYSTIKNNNLNERTYFSISLFVSFIRFLQIEFLTARSTRDL